ncbi:MAG TPA: CHAT domain-containing protein, partial [Longimicrobium sp.]|nr:CHAT domain-containing protein [Longimicrobium sp.]
RGAFPREWARMRHLCGMAHLQRGGRDPLSGADDAVLGLQALADALQVLTPAAYPHDALVTARVMGVAAAERGDWELAVTGYTRAVEAAEQLRRQATAEARRDEIIASAADAFAGLVRSLLHAGRPAEALAAAERGKARELSELLAEQNLRPSAAVPQAEVEELGRARAAELSAVRILSAAQLRQEISGGGDEPGDATLAEHVAAVEVARAAVDRALTAIQARDPAFALAQAESPPPTPDELAALLPDDHTALLSLYAGGNVHAFVLTRAGVRVEVTPDDEREALERALVAYFEAFAAAGSPEWWLDERLGAVINATEFVSRALALLPDHVDRLLLVPHQHLHLLPLHALKVAGQMLVDRFPRGVAYAPSARLLGLAQGRERRAFDFLMAVQDPASNGADPLPAADQEVTMVAERFTHPPRVLRGEEATRAALLGAPELLTANALHFACHGQFEPANPLDSALLLAGDDELTLAEVFALELDDCRLAVLSACGTGRVGVGNTEEYVGLPAGFLYAGSAAVVSSLWSVDDVSTALLAARMYHRLRERGDPCAPYAVAEALAFAQRWLRDSTTTELENWLGEHYPDTLAPYAERMRSGARRRRRGPSEDEAGEWYPDDCPFAEPFYWAPFIATGC